MLATSNSDTTVQYRSAQKSVITRIAPMPDFSMSFDIARNFSTIGRTLPGLQYMTSRMSSMAAPLCGDDGIVARHVPRTEHGCGESTRVAPRRPIPIYFIGNDG